MQTQVRTVGVGLPTSRAGCDFATKVLSSSLSLLGTEQGVDCSGLKPKVIQTNSLVLLVPDVLEGEPTLDLSVRSVEVHHKLLMVEDEGQVLLAQDPSVVQGEGVVIHPIKGSLRSSLNKRAMVNGAIIVGKLTQVSILNFRISLLPALVRRLGTEPSISRDRMLDQTLVSYQNQRVKRQAIIGRIG